MTSAEEYRLRRLLWMAYSNGRGYGDDGELQLDGIDFRRMTVEEIDAALMKRGLLEYHREKSEIERLREAARELITRLDEMEKPLNNVCVLAYVHGSEYSGPNWRDPLAKLRALVQESDALAEKVQK